MFNNQSHLHPGGSHVKDGFRFPKALVLGLALSGMVLIACGDDDDDGADSAATTAAGGADTTAAEETTTTVEPQTVTVMMFPGLSYRLPALVAQEQGFLADHGIEMEIIAQPGNVSGIQGLEATGADLGYFSVTTLAQAVQAGSDVAFFCGSQDIVETSLMVAADADFPSTDEGASADEALAALSGTSIGVQTPIGSGLQLFFNAAIEEEGVTDITYVNTGVQLPIVSAALVNGDVDVVQTSPPATQQLIVDGQGKRIMFLPEDLDDYQLYGSANGAPRSFLEESPELARGWCDAIQEAVDWINDPANADAAAALLAEDSGVSEEVAALVVEESYPTFSTEIPEDTFDETTQRYIDLGVLQPTPDVSYSAIVSIPE